MKKHLEADLTVITGSMFSGKSTALKESMKRYSLAGFKTKTFKLDFDNRGEGDGVIRTHSEITWPATSVRESREILSHVACDVEVVGIDEVQFFDPNIVSVIKEMQEIQKLKVLVAGLPTDFRGEPFGAMPILLALADHINRINAVCRFIDQEGLTCGNEATRTQRLINGKPAHYSEPIVVVGAEQLYEARCVRHHIVPGKPKYESQN